MTHNDLASIKQAVQRVDFSAVVPAHSDKNVGKTEQDASVIGGAVLVGLGLSKITHPTGWAMLAVGGGLLYRGLTGVCGLYKAFGINTRE